MAKPKPVPRGTADNSKKARAATDAALTKASKAKTADGAVRNLLRLARGKR